VRGVLLETALPSGWIATMVDRHGYVLADNSERGDIVGQPLTRVFWDTINDRGSATGEAVVDLVDGATLVAFNRSKLSGWVAVITVPTALLLARLRRTFVGLTAIAILILAFAGGMAALFSRRINRPVGALAVE